MDGSAAHSQLTPDDQRPIKPSAPDPGDVATLTNSIRQLSVDASSLAPVGHQSTTERHTSQPESPNNARQIQPHASRSSIPASRSSNGSRNNVSQPGSPAINRKASNPLLQRRDDSNSYPRPSSRRLASGTSSPRVASFGAQPIQEPEETKPLSASAIASEHFKKQLSYHNDSGTSDTETVVIVKDACYGHRYARPKTSKATLSMIVERPERLQASVLGISSAYIRLGQIHAEGRDAPCPDREPSADLPFRIHKTDTSFPLTSPTVAAVHGSKWMQELQAMCETADSKLASGSKELSRPDTPTGTGSGATKPKLHEGDLYLCGQSLDALQNALGGVCEAVDLVFGEEGSKKAHKRAFVGVRPPGHHCSSEHPSGFCWINNVHVGIEHAAHRHGLTHAAIIDFDLHHGDGSQAITWERNTKASKAQKSGPKASFAPKKTSIGYFSLHDVNSYPCEDGDASKVQAASTCIENAHNQNIWNVHLQPWKTEHDFWKLYETQYLVVLDKARNFLTLQSQKLKSSNPRIQPKAAIFISAGFDASEWEMETMQRHKVSVPTEFYARFSSDIVKLAKEPDTGVDGRVISVLEGGYSDRALMSGILSHLSGLVGEMQPAAKELSQGSSDLTNSLEPNRSAIRWDKSWWSPESLAEIEGLLKQAAPPPPPKKVPRSTEMPTYSSPTQSFTAKVVDPSKVFRSTSGSSPSQPKSRPSTPPPPPVGWATSVHELCKLLVPSDRQIDSHSHDELKEVRVKRERQSSIGPHTVETSGDRMQLRGRRPKGAAEQMSASASLVPEANRRRTISDLTSVAADTAVGSSTTSHPTVVSAERSSASGSGAQSDKAPNAVSSRAASNAQQAATPQGPSGKVNVPRTRRTSGTGSDVRNVSNPSSKVPPVPPFPQEFQPQVTNDKSGDKTLHAKAKDESNRAGSVEALSAGVKKISLKMPKQAKPNESTDRATKPAAKPGRKPVVKDSQQAPGQNIRRKPSKLEDPKLRSDPVPKSALQESPKPTQNSRTVAVDEPAIKPDPSTNAEYLPGPNNDPKENADLNNPQHDLSNQGSNRHETRDVISPVASDAIAQEGVSSDPQNLSQPQADHGQTEFIPYIPPGPAEHHTSSPTTTREPLTWLPPNTGTPVKDALRNDKENLPVFSSHGPIPFAKAGESTPLAAAPASNAAQPSAQDQEASSSASRTPLEHNKPSIWDVPETPPK